MTLILGIDPGTHIAGYGLIKHDKDGVRHVKSGTIRLSSSLALPDKLKVIYEEIDKLIGVLKPDAFAIEEVFFAHNVRSVLKLGESRGVAILAARNNNIPVYEYSAREVKQGITGYGNATKDQVQKMVKKILKIDVKLVEDASDALAIAICHSNTANLSRALDKAKKEIMK